jgi:hypothetical protein
MCKRSLATLKPLNPLPVIITSPTIERTTMITKTIAVRLTGQDDAALEDAFDEATSRIKAGNTSGFDRNEESSFTFDVTTDSDPEGANETARRIIRTWTRGLITLSEMVTELQKVADAEYRKSLLELGDQPAEKDQAPHHGPCDWCKESGELAKYPGGNEMLCGTCRATIARNAILSAVPDSPE